MIENGIKKEVYNDICITCKNYTSCIQIRNGKRPIHFCEEFENELPPPLKERSNPVEARLKEEKLVFYGICKNCGNRMTCMNASPERIIWHCEEYV